MKGSANMSLRLWRIWWILIELGDRFMRVVLGAFLGLLSAFSANAADDPVFRSAAQPTLSPESGLNSIVSEFRLGVFGHSYFSDNEQNSIDINGELLFAKPFTSTDPWIDALLPRPHIGATINTEGLTSMGYAGFTWTLPLGERVFVEGTLGASINNGVTGPAAGSR
jgi:lipid A 3-O-deacylase